MTQFLRVAGPSPAAPTTEASRACSAHLRQETGKGSQGLAPGKRPGQAPCRSRLRAILISSPGPAPPVQDPRGNEAAGRNVVGRLRFSQSKGDGMFSGTSGPPWDHSCSHQCPPPYFWKVIKGAQGCAPPPFLRAIAAPRENPSRGLEPPPQSAIS